MKFRFFIYLIVVPGFIFQLIGADVRLTGKILESGSGKPLKGAEIVLKKSGCGAVADADGRFRLICKNVKPNDVLVVYFLGYREEKIPLRKFSEGTAIYLRPKSLKFGDEIVVSAERIDIIKQDIPHAKNIVDFKEIQQTGSSEIADILKPLPAVRIEGNDLDGRKIQIRGSDPDEVNVYLDGVLLNDVGFDNAADLSIIPVEAIESIEVLRGANLAFVGSGAFGGVVSIRTLQNKNNSYFIKGKIGSFGSRYLVGSVNVPLSKKVTVNYFGQANRMTPVIEYFPGERFSPEKTRNSEISTSKQNHNLKVDYFSRSGHLSTRFFGYSLNYQKPLWESDYRNYLFTTGYSGKIFGAKDFDVLINHLYSRNKISRHPVGSAKYDKSYIGNRFNLKIAKKYRHKSGDIQLLSEYFHDDLLNDTGVKSGSVQRNLYHAFLYDNRWSFSGVASFSDYLHSLPNLSWKTYIGFRTDFIANGDKDLTHQIGAQVEYQMKHWKLSPYFNYGKNVKYPTLLENAYITDLTNITRTDTVSTHLKPEYSNAVEIGMSANYVPEASFYRQMDFGFSLFTRTVYNRLLRRPFDDEIANIQIGRNVTRGVETLVKIHELLKRFTLGISFVQLDITNPLLYSYKPKKNLSVNFWYNTRTGFYFTSTYFYEGKSLAWYYDTAGLIQTEEIQPFNDADLSAGFTIPLKSFAIDFQFSAHNIFDNSGFLYYYLKKRYLQFSMTIKR